MIQFVFDFLILILALVAFGIAYTVARWIHVPEPACSLLATLWGCYAIGFGFLRQGFPADKEAT